MNYFDIFWEAYRSYATYFWHEITHPTFKNYFYWLIALSLFFMALEWIRPWRESQPRFRKDFWLDAFYMFFNFFLFSLIIYNAASEVVVTFFNSLVLQLTNINLREINPLTGAPMWVVLLTGFIVRDFVQWWTHRLLHRIPFLWKFHQVHHSVQQMGFAAHLRFHWMETIVYRTIEYIPLALLGIGLYDFFIIHIFTTAVGHYNHANITVSGKVTGGILGFLIGLLIANNLLDINLFYLDNWGKVLLVAVSTLSGILLLSPFMKIIFNSPEMHIWHHAKALPEAHSYGVNFGLTLAIWDYIFATAYIPYSGKNIPLGFENVEKFPDSFGKQVIYGFGSNIDDDK